LPSPLPAPLTGHAAGVPFAAVPPAGRDGDDASGGTPRADAPVVLAWHLADPPRTEAAFAAALPLDGLDAWRIYLGLPMLGSRLPAGGFDEIMRLGYEDAVLNLQGPTASQALEELGPALAALRDRLELGDGPLGVLGGSMGAAVAQLVMAESGLPIAAAVLVSPLIQLRRAVAAMSEHYGIEYRWSPASEAVADRLDFVARAGELTRDGRPAVLLAVGEEDDAGFRDAAAELRAALAAQGAQAELLAIPGMGHALAEEPGTDPAPQTPHAATVDRAAVAWFRRHLG
jgi:dienelactone hydrolase